MILLVRPEKKPLPALNEQGISYIPVWLTLSSGLASSCGFSQQWHAASLLTPRCHGGHSVAQIQENTYAHASF